MTMLYRIQMDRRVPPDAGAAHVERLKALEKSRVQEPRQAGVWRHLWRVAGRCANISVFDVADHDEPHTIPSRLPPFPIMDITVTPLARHPSATRQRDFISIAKVQACNRGF